LGLLAWMCDLARYHSCLRGRQEEEETSLVACVANGRAASAVGTSAHFWWYLRETYSSYLAGEDGAVEEVETEILSAFDAAARAGELEVAASEAAMGRTVSELEALATAHTILPAIRSASAEVAGDISRLEAALMEMQAYGESLLKKKGEKLAEVRALEGEVATGTKELQRLGSIVAQQEISQDDLRRLKAQGTAMRERRAAIDGKKMDLDQELVVAHEELRKNISAVSSRLGSSYPTSTIAFSAPLTHTSHILFVSL